MDGNFPSIQFPAEARVGIGQHRFLRHPERLKIPPCIANVIEAAIGKLALQGFTLRLIPKMDFGIARDDTRKYSEMIGNAFGLLFVRCRHKENVSPDRVLTAEKFKQGSVIRE